MSTSRQLGHAHATFRRGRLASSPRVWASSSQGWVEATLAMAQRVKSDFGRALGAVGDRGVRRNSPTTAEARAVCRVFRFGRFGRFDGTAVVPRVLRRSVA